MNICLLNLDYVPFRTAGLTVYGELLASGLCARGHQVTMIASRRQGAPGQELIDGVRVLRVPIGPTDWLGFGLQAARILARLQQHDSFDVIHFLDVRFAWAFRGHCLATVFESFHQRMHAKGDRPYAHNRANYVWRSLYFRIVDRTLQRWTLTRPQMLIASSKSTRDEFVQHYGFPADRVFTVPLGIDTARFTRRDPRALRERLQLEGKRVVLYVGFSTPRKGVEYLAQAMGSLDDECRLLLVGKWEPGYRDMFFRSLPEQVRGKVLEAGYVADEELPEYYSLADVFVFPSLLEGFGLPVVEAMACGTPVIAARTSSLPEVVGDAGILVPAMDAAALAKALSTVLGDENLRGELARRGLERVRRLFGAERMVTGTLRVYQAFRERAGAEYVPTA